MRWAFQELQRALLEAPALALPDPAKPFQLFVDEKQGVGKGELGPGLLAMPTRVPETPASLAQSKSSSYFLYFLHTEAGPFQQTPGSVACSTQQSLRTPSLAEESLAREFVK